MSAQLPEDKQVWTDEFGRRCSKAVKGIWNAPHWCVGTTKHGTVAAPTEEAARALFKELTGEDIVKCGRLPYGADPALNVIVYPSGQRSTDGYFCFAPARCVGHSSCPRRRACSE